MAKQKEKKNITFEEKLEQALVSIEEQPYEIPSNWVWSYVGNFVSIFRGVSYKKDDAHNKKEIDDYLILRGGNILEGELDFDNDNVYVNKTLVNKEQLLQKHDVIIVASTGSKKVIGRAGISQQNFSDIAFGAFLMLVRPKSSINSEYLDYFFQCQLYRDRIRELASGTNINNIRTEHITSTCFPLPPLLEQQRIVDLIERLFAKLDEAKEKVQTAIDSFELRKAAILHKAFTGKLTAKWREENGRPLSSFASQKPLPPTANALGADLKMCPHAGGEAGVEATIQQDAPPEFLKKIAGGAVERSETEGVLLDQSTAEGLPCGWKQTKLSEVVDDFKYGTCEKSNYTNTGLPVLRIPNIGENGEINLDDLKYLSTDNIGEAHLVKNNDILIIRSNGSRDLVGKCALIENLTNNYAYASFLIRVRPTNDIYPKFLSKYLSSKDAQNQMFNFAKSSAGIHNINSQELGAINLKLPPLSEQKEIVRILDTLLAKSDKAKELAENALENIETLKKTILAKAFRGLLGTNRADEPSSLELLKEVL